MVIEDRTLPRPWPIKRAGGKGTLMVSDTPLELERGMKEESERRKALGLPRAALYHVLCDAMASFLADLKEPRVHVYYVDGRGPYMTTHEALDALGVPAEGRGQYWFRHDRLPKEYQDKIEVRDAEGEGGS